MFKLRGAITIQISNVQEKNTDEYCFPKREKTAYKYSGTYVRRSKQ
jgi:hypothetical protein